MKKPASKIRQEITRLQEQLRQAETREAERIGRIALRAGLAEIEIDESELLAAFEELAGRFYAGYKQSPGRGKDQAGTTGGTSTAMLAAGPAAGGGGEV